MNVLVTGAGGFLGIATVKRLREEGHNVSVIVRSRDQQSAFPADVVIWQADLRVPDQYINALKDIEVVIHLAAAVSGSEDQQFSSTVIGTETLLSQLDKFDVKKFIHISTIAIYNWKNISGEMNETSSLADDNICELGSYAFTKYWQEKVIIEKAQVLGLQLRVLRPGFIWGPERPTFAGMGRTFGRLHVTFGPFTRLPLTYVDNCADCICTALNDQKDQIEIFNVVDSDEIRAWRYCRACFKQLEQKMIIVPVPYRLGYLFTKLADMTARFLFGPERRLPSLLMPVRYQSQFKPIRYSTRKLHQVLKWSPVVNFKTAIKHLKKVT